MYRQTRLKYWGKRPNKYKAVRTACQAQHTHRSGLEASVCDELRLRQAAGEIESYEIEYPIRLELEGVKLGTYWVDFKVINGDGSTEFVEAKGMQLPTWKQKWKIAQAMFRNDPTVKFRVVTR